VLGDKSAQPNASAKTMTQVKLRIPPLPEQRAIAHILGTLDDKIELNRRMNETLEAMAQALFKSWFVDLEPFRDQGMEDSPLGPIPKGWRVGILGDIADNQHRGIHPKNIDPSTPYIGLEHMPRKCIGLSEWGHAKELESNKFRFKKGEFLFGKLRPYFHKVGVAPLDGVCSTDILVIAPKEPACFGFVLGHISSTEFVAYTDAGSTGTKMPRTNWQDMACYEIVIPPQPLAESFNEVICPLADKIIRNIHQSHTLASIRDTLLPKLLSGEIRVKDAERFAERAV
jgi:type I restriction enzyme S subunit